MKSCIFQKTLLWDNTPNLTKLNNYKSWLEDKNFTKETIENYLATIIQYGERNVDTHSISSFFREILSRYQPATLRSKRNALTSYAKFLQINIYWERIRRILPTEQRKPYPILSEEEFKQLLSLNTYTDKLTNERNNLILEFLWYLGIRINELINIRHCDYSSNDGFIRVRGKFNKYRSLFLPPFLVPYFNPFSKECLLLTRHGKPLTKGQIRRNIKKKAQLAGIKRNISPHSFRRSLATNSHNLSVRIDTIQKQLGHTNINTTLGYINNDYQAYYQDCSKYWPTRI